MSTLDLLIARYVDAAIRQGEGWRSGDYRKTNTASDAPGVLAAALEEHGDVSKAAVARLMDHESMHVRGRAARDCLFFPEHEEKARRTLSEIARQDEGMTGFNAEMVLEVWDKGELHDCWPSTQATCNCPACREAKGEAMS